MAVNIVLYIYGTSRFEKESLVGFWRRADEAESPTTFQKRQ